ncbi:MAG: response regulator transcription factor [Actinomycetaceae bacterium]|nr:response regulator transcription factor [Actinomycetaceae bacterium]
MSTTDNSVARTIRVVLVDDDALVRSGLGLILGGDKNIRVVGEGSDGRSGIDAAIRLGADVVLMDLRMPTMDGVEATTELTRTHPEIRILVLTAFDTDSLISKALSAGAAGFLLKDTAPEQIIAAIHEVAGGGRAFSDQVMDYLVEAATSNPTITTTPWPEDVTDREREVAILLMEGLTNTQIAERLMVGPATVKTHVSTLLTKFGVENRVQLALEISRCQGLA